MASGWEGDLNVESGALTGEVEAERLARLAELVDVSDPAEHGRFLPGSFGCHELLDRTALTQQAIDDWLLGHPACLSRAEWYRLALSAHEALNELYRQVSEAHIPVEVGREEPAG